MANLQIGCMYWFQAIVAREQAGWQVGGWVVRYGGGVGDEKIMNTLFKISYESKKHQL